MELNSQNPISFANQSRFDLNKSEAKENLNLFSNENKSKIKIKCNREGCETLFSSNNAYLNHIRKIHENVKMFCDYCKKEYKYSSCKKGFLNFFFHSKKTLNFHFLSYQ